MTTAKPLLETPKFNPWLEAARPRIKAAAAEAVRLGIADKQGNLPRTDLPPDRIEGSDRDFGG